MKLSKSIVAVSAAALAAVALAACGSSGGSSSSSSGAAASCPLGAPDESITSTVRIAYQKIPNGEESSVQSSLEWPVGGTGGSLHRLHDVRPHQDVALDRVSVADDAAGPLQAVVPCEGRRAALAVDDAGLPLVAAVIGRDERIEGLLHAALLAGDRAGGDARGRQSAALLIGGVGAGYGGGSDSLRGRLTVELVRERTPDIHGEHRWLTPDLLIGKLSVPPYVLQAVEARTDVYRDAEPPATAGAAGWESSGPSTRPSR